MYLYVRIYIQAYIGLYVYVLDHPQCLCNKPHQFVKFYVNLMYSFEGMGIGIFADLA